MGSLRKMLFLCFVLIIIFNYLNFSFGLETESEDRSYRSLSRKKRYLSFPEGSSFSAALCMTIGAIGNPNVNWLSYALNWGLAYELPNSTWILHHANPFGDADYKTKQERSAKENFFSKMETIIDNMGYDGRDCILRIICETAKSMNEGKGTIVQELLKVLFRVPKLNSISYDILRDYDIASDNGDKGVHCMELHSKCNLPFFDMVLEKIELM